MSLHQCNHWYLCFCLLSPFCNAVLRPRCRQAAALWFSKSGRTFANIVWISLLLLYSALYLVWLVHYIFRLEICQKINTTRFLSQKFYTLKMRKLRLFLPTIKHRKFQYKWLIEMKILNFNSIGEKDVQTYQING